MIDDPPTQFPPIFENSKQSKIVAIDQLVGYKLGAGRSSPVRGRGEGLVLVLYLHFSTCELPPDVITPRSRRDPSNS
jgi:hypothetical protein